MRNDTRGKKRGALGASSTAIETVEDLLKATGAGDVVQLRRYAVRTGTWDYLGPFEPSLLEALGITEFTRQRFGGGKFKAQIRHRGGAFGLARTFSIAGTEKVPDDEAAPAASLSAPANGASSSNPPAWIEKILLPIGVTFATALGGYLSKKLLEAPSADPLIVEMLKSLRAAGTSIDPLELQRAIAEAEHRGETRGRELGKLRAQVDAPPKDVGGVAGAIDRGIPQVVELLNRKLELDHQRSSSPATAALTPSPGTGPAAPGDDAAQATPVPTDPLVALLLGVPPIARRFLLAAAEANEAPETYAELVLGKLDDVTYARMPAFLERSDFVDVFVATYPAFAPHRPWVDELAGAMRESLQEAVDDADRGDARDLQSTESATASAESTNSSAGKAKHAAP